MCSLHMHVHVRVQFDVGSYSRSLIVSSYQAQGQLSQGAMA